MSPMGDRDEWRFDGAIQRALRASQHRRNDNAGQAESPSTTDSCHRVGPELAIIMANQSAIMEQLVEMEMWHTSLPAPTGNTFEPTERALMQAGTTTPGATGD